jgi:hypothetical protein
MENKEYTLRPLEADDLFAVSGIINAIGVEDAKKCFMNVELSKMIGDSSDEQVAAIGTKVMIDLASLLVQKLPVCKSELYRFLSSLSGVAEEEIAHIKLVPFTKMVMDVFKKEEITDFFQLVFGSLK